MQYTCMEAPADLPARTLLMPQPLLIQNSLAHTPERAPGHGDAPAVVNVILLGAEGRGGGRNSRGVAQPHEPAWRHTPTTALCPPRQSGAWNCAKRHRGQTKLRRWSIIPSETIAKGQASSAQGHQQWGRTAQGALRYASILGGGRAEFGQLAE